MYSLLAGFYLSPCGKWRTTSYPMRTESVAGGLLLVGVTTAAGIFVSGRDWFSFILGTGDRGKHKVSLPKSLRVFFFFTGNRLASKLLCLFIPKLTLESRIIALCCGRKSPPGEKAVGESESRPFLE